MEGNSKNSFWGIMRKVGLIATIVSVLVPPFYDWISHKRAKLNSVISISEYSKPIHQFDKDYYKEASTLFPHVSKPREIAQLIHDSVLTSLELDKKEIVDVLKKSNLKLKIEMALPEPLSSWEFSKTYVDIRNKENYILNSTRTYLETKLENTGDAICKNIVFEIPTTGHYEYYDGENLIKHDEFKYSIILGDLRPTNNLTIKIWAYNRIYFSDLQNAKYTFDEGSIQPIQLKAIRQDKFIFWLNDFGVFNFIGMLCFIVSVISFPTYLILRQINKNPVKSNLE